MVSNLPNRNQDTVLSQLVGDGISQSADDLCGSMVSHSSWSKVQDAYGGERKGPKCSAQGTCGSIFLTFFGHLVIFQIYQMSIFQKQKWQVEWVFI